MENFSVFSGRQQQIERTSQVKALEAYACRVDVRHILERLLGDLLQKQPDEPLQYMIDWLQREQVNEKDCATFTCSYLRCSILISLQPGHITACTLAIQQRVTANEDL
eukprot:jgi/Botrbrau1/717/Bobra.160_2s0040.1